MSITANAGYWFMYYAQWVWSGAGTYPGYQIDHVTYNNVQMVSPTGWDGSNPPGFGVQLGIGGNCASNWFSNQYTNAATVTLPLGGTNWAGCQWNQTLASMTTKVQSNWQLQHLTQPWTLNVGSVQMYLVASAVTPQELYGGSNPAVKVPRSCAGHPVDCATGNQWEQASDLSVPGLGRGLDLTRTYNSQAAVSASAPGMFGYGWSSTYSAHLAINGTAQTVTVVHDNGSQAVFDQNTDGTYSALPEVHSSLVKNGDGSYTYTLPDRSTLSFDANGRLTAEGDRDGNQTTVSYDSQGHLTRVTDPAGRQLSLSYNTDGTVSQATDPAGHSVSYSYSSGNLVQVTDVGGGQWHYGYDASHQLTSMTDPRGGTVTTSYDGSHRVVSQTDALNRKRTWSYPSSSETVITNPGGDVTDEHFMSLLPVQITRASGTSSATTKTIAYDDMSDPTKITDGNGNSWTYTYDSAGNRTSAPDALGRKTSWTYDAQRDVTSITTPLGHVTTIAYDQHGNPTSVSRTLTETGQVQKTGYAYDGKGELTSVTDPLSRVTSYGYDAYGNRTSATSPLGHKTSYGFDGDSRLISVTTADGNVPGGTPASFTTTFTRDAFGRVTDAADPRGHHTLYVYDANGNLTDQTDRDGRHTTTTYDADNEPTKLTRGDGSIQLTGYDANGQITSQTDGNSHTTSYQRDPLEEITQIKDPLGRARGLGYDPAGNLIVAADPSGRTTTYGYDTANELTGIHYSSGNPGDVSFTYNADGNPTYMTDETGPTAWQYDSLDRLAQYDTGIGSWCPQTGPPPPGHAGTTTSYTWDLANELTGIGYPSAVIETSASAGASGGSGSSAVSVAGAVARTFDNDGRITVISDWLGNTTSYSYDAESNITGVQRPDGSAANYGYDANSKLTSINDASPGGFSFAANYTRTPEELLANADETKNAGGASQTYAYDQVGRLNQITTAGLTGSSKSYGYDAADDLTSQPAPNSTLAQTYDAASELTAATNAALNSTQTFGYDSDGNRTGTTSSAGTQTYGYDQADRLASYISAAQNATNSQTGNHSLTAQYSYDGSGLRTQKIANGVATVDAYDISAALPLLLLDGTTSYVYGPDGLPIEQVVPTLGGSGNSVTSTAVRYFHHDQLGSTRALTDASGHPVATYNYTAYGQTLSSNTSVANPLLYGGQYTDSETGLQYLRARYYDPATAQFITRDPLQAFTREPYAYAGDDPLNKSDPSGLGFWDDVGNFAAGFGDTVTFGGTKAIRQAIGNDNVDYCSTAYGAGGTTGLGVTALIPGEGEATGAAEASGALSEVERVGSALKDDALHRAASWVVDNPAAQRFTITGGDGVQRTLYQLPGEVNGKSGIFEWIVDDSSGRRVITHQRFIPGGEITGSPNQQL